MEKKERAKSAKAALVAAVAAAALALAAEAAGWQPAGRIQVASQKALDPLVAELGRQANFTLLPMLVRQGLAGCETAMKFGPPLETSDFGMAFFADGAKTEAVLLWPLSRPAPAELPANAAVTKDGKWACVCDSDAALAKAVAAKGVSFAKPVSKGFFNIVLEGRELFENVGAMLKSDAAALEAMTGQKYEDESYIAHVARLAKELSQVRVAAGLSKSGLDLRFRAMPKKGGELSGATQPLPSYFLDSSKEAGVEVLQFYGASAVKGGPGACEALVKAIPECKAAKEPLFAFSVPLGATADPAAASGAAAASATPPAAPQTIATAWIFAWRESSGEFRAIARLPSADLAKAFASMVSMQSAPM